MYFVLKNIDPVQLDKKYGFSTDPRHEDRQSLLTLSSSEIDGKKKTSKLLDLQPQNVREVSPIQYSFIDESKVDHQCVVTMKPHLSKECLPQSTSIFCFWCRHSFPYRPIGCPIEYVPHRMIKTYNSEIVRDSYILRENITPAQLRCLASSSRESLPPPTTKTSSSCDVQLQSRDYYMVDGIFCSFNCCLAFIRDHQNHPMYGQSESYLRQMYHDLFVGNNTNDRTQTQTRPPPPLKKKKSVKFDRAVTETSMNDKQLPINLQPAPSWRLLKDYGGHLSIDEFRKNFYKIDYLDINHYVSPFPNTKPIGFLYEKQVRI